MERYRGVKTRAAPLAYLSFSFRSVSEFSKAGILMNVFELTRALVDIESITENEAAVGAYLVDHLSKLAARTGGRAERMDVEGSRFNVWPPGASRASRFRRTWTPSRRFSLARGRRIHLGPRRVRRQGHHRVDGLRRRKSCSAKGVKNFGTAVRGRRGAQQRGRAGRREDAARLAVPGEWRADGKQAGVGVEGTAALE